jgi:hypothetical protein
METRREALKIIGAVGVTCAFPFSANQLYGQLAHQHQQSPPDAVIEEVPYKPIFFTPTQFQLVSRLADLIIPTTDTPGAVGAGVPSYIDLIVSADPKLRSLFEKGLQRLDVYSGSTFLQLTEAQQVDILTAFSNFLPTFSNAASTSIDKSIEYNDGLFFRAIKNLTADGYYTSRVGLLQELGYNGNSVLAAFPTSTIPEH